MALGYEIPQDLKYTERILGMLTFRQAFYLAVSLILAFIVFRSGVMPSLKTPLVYAIIGLGFSVAFLNLDGLAWQFLRFTVTRMKLRGMKDVAGDLLRIKHVERDSVVKQDGLLGIIEVTGINVSMLNDGYMKEVIYAYRSFINSLAFEIQIFVRSTDLSLDGYFDSLEGTCPAKTDRERLREIRSFRKFLTGWVKEQRVKCHGFYVIVPLPRSKGLLDGRKDSGFEELGQRVEIVMRNLREIGFDCRRLDGMELLELYASCFDSEVKDG